MAKRQSPVGRKGKNVLMKTEDQRLHHTIGRVGTDDVLRSAHFEAFIRQGFVFLKESSLSLTRTLEQLTTGG